MLKLSHIQNQYRSADLYCLSNLAPIESLINPGSLLFFILIYFVVVGL